MAGVEIFDPRDIHRIDYTSPSLLHTEMFIFRTPVEFSEFIEMFSVKNSMTVTQVLLDYCEEHDLEYGQLAAMLTQNLKNKIAAEMQESGLLPKTATLSFE